MQYSQDLIAPRALQFVDDHKDEPFFLYYAMTLPHANNEAGKKGMEIPDHGIYTDLDWPEAQKGHAAMISRMDADVGAILDRLQHHGIDDNTIVMFTSDNGPHREGGNNSDFNDSNGSLKGIKRDLTEGGIRVPMIVRWPGNVEAGSTSIHAGAFWDLMATCADIAGVEEQVPDDTDGVSFLPALLGNSDQQEEHDFLYWAFYERGGARALRAGDWKVVHLSLIHI